MRSSLLSAVLAALALEGCEYTEGQACMEVDSDAEACPAPDEVEREQLFAASGTCDNEVSRITQETTPTPGPGGFDVPLTVCCYDAVLVDKTPMSTCIVGRPYRAACTDAPHTFPLPSSGGWARLAQLEHASVAAFARLTLELMRHGAPVAILREAQRAALDEVDHCAAALEVHARREGAVAEPGPGALQAALDLDRPLAELVADVVRDGCVGETVSAALLRAAAEAGGPEAAVLKRLADDEERHAALSWRIAAWALAAGGVPVREAIRSALAAPVVVERPDQDGPLSELGEDGVLAVAEATLREVIRPAAAVLLSA